MRYASNGMRVAAIGILLVVGILAPAAGARPLLKGTKRSDRLSGGSAAETLNGGKGNDRLSGGGGNDLLLGGPGNDRLTGGAGRDNLRGDAGSDLLNARDGKADRVDCGPGKDKAVVDAIDRPVRGCERVDVKKSAVSIQQPAPAVGTPVSPILAPPSQPPFDASNEHELIAAGDIADCTAQDDEATASLVDELPGVVAIPGDAVYEYGLPEEYTNCYEPGWGRHKWRTHPVVGDHDYKTPGAAGFFGYFGLAGGEMGKGWYSYDVGSWHVVALNSNCDQIGGCAAGSPEEAWLRSDLAAHQTACTLAYWHAPLFSSGSHGGEPAVKPLFQALYDNGVEIVVNGHDHDYERFAPQNPGGGLDPAKGVREFVVGMGGRLLRPLDATHQPNSEAANDTSFGVLDLKLNAAGYDWQYVPVPGSSFADSGTDTCH
jgi:hypothetical protein